MGKRGPTCSICADPRVDEINRRISRREKITEIARELAVSEDALYRHKQKCIVLALSAAPNTKDVITGTALLEQLQAARAEAIRLLDMAIAAGNVRAYGAPSNYLREIREQIRLWAELEGKLSAQAQINLTQFNIYNSPEWDAVGKLLERELADYPELRARVARGLRELAEAHK